MSIVIGRFRKMHGTAVWVSPVRSHIVDRARLARDGGDGWIEDIATVGFTSFLRALALPADADPKGRRVRVLDVIASVVTAPLGLRVQPTYWLPTPTADSPEVFVTLFRDGEYPTLALVGGVNARAVTGSHMQVQALEDPIGWVSRITVQAEERRAAA